MLKKERKVKYSKHIPAMRVPDKRRPPSCDTCSVMACWPKGPEEVLKGPATCPTKNYPDLIKKAKEMYIKDPFHPGLQGSAYHFDREGPAFGK